MPPMPEDKIRKKALSNCDHYDSICLVQFNPLKCRAMIRRLCSQNKGKPNQVYFKIYFSPKIDLMCCKKRATHSSLPVMGLTQDVQRLANSSPKQSAQYGFSSRDVKRCPASEVLQLVHVKHSLCHGSFL